MRNALLWFHRWTALAGMLFIVILAVTGSALVFEGAIDRALRPDLWRVTPGATRVSLDTLVARAAAAVPGLPGTGVSLSPAEDRAYLFQFAGTQVFVDPYTGAVKGTRTGADFNKTLPRRLHVLHVSLMAGKTGGRIVGIATIVSLLLVLTGLIAWWPDKLWRIRWSASWKRVVFDLHHFLGLVAALVLLIVTTSGLFIHYESLNGLMARLNREPLAPAPKQPKPASNTPSISADSLYRIAAGALPGARVIFLSLPGPADQPYVASLRFPEDRTPGGRSRVFVDRYSGTVLAARSTREAQLGTKLSNSVRSVHTGDLLGKPTEAVWLLAAIVLASQTVTGFLMWWNGRAGRAAKQRAAGS